MDRLGKKAEVEPEIASYLHYKAKEQGIPLSGTFELTSRCNFNCKMCYIHTEQCNQKAEELPAEWWIQAGKEAAEQGMLFLLLTGGEPLARPDFPYIYTELKKLGLLISINTNGSLLEGEIAELFRKDPPTRLNISLYGASDDSYETFTGQRAFSRVLENIKRMDSYGIDVKLNGSFTKDNGAEMEQIFNLAQELDLHMKTTSYMYPQVRTDGKVGENQRRMTPKEAAAARVGWSLLRYDAEEFLLRAKGMEKGISMFPEDCVEEQEAEGVRCRAGTSSFWLNYQGMMSMCGMIDKGFDVKTLGFAVAWEKVREFTAKVTLPKDCSNCKYRHFCNICAAVSYTETGDFSKRPDYSCQMCEEVARLTQLERERLEKTL